MQQKKIGLKVHVSVGDFFCIFFVFFPMKNYEKYEN